MKKFKWILTALLLIFCGSAAAGPATIRILASERGGPFVLKLAEISSAGDSIRILDSAVPLPVVIPGLQDLGWFQMTLPVGDSTILATIFTEDSGLDTVTRDSLETIYKSSLLRRDRRLLQHLTPPSDSTEFAFFIRDTTQAETGPLEIPAFYRMLADSATGTGLIRLLLPGRADTLNCRLFPTSYPPDWIELYSIETLFADMIATRDSIDHLLFTFPADSDTIYQVQVRFGGWARDTAAVLIIAGDTVDIYASGAFAGLYKLEPGWNNYPVIVTTDTSRREMVMQLYNPPAKYEFTGDRPVLVAESIYPGENIIFRQPDRLIVRVRGSAGGTAEFKIPHLTGGFRPMMEITDGNGSDGSTLYEGVFDISGSDRCRQQPIIFRLKNADGKSGTIRSKARISVAIDRQPTLVVTADSESLLRYAPGGEILTIQPAGIVLETIAESDRWLKVRLSENRSAYIYRYSVKNLPAGGGAREAALYSISSTVDSDWVSVNFNLSAQVPFRIVQGSDPQRLSVYFYCTRFQDEWTVYPDSSDLIEQFDWNAEDDDLLRFDIYLNTSQQWGYRGYYEGNRFRLDLKVPPRINPENPFAGLTFILDAGHGGRHRGAVGSTGLMEKDVNLVYTQYLGKMLQERGARVVVTRQIDTTLSLSERMDIARQEHGDIFVWMHNNAAGSSRNPLEVSGTSTYYTSPQNWPFARAVYPRLLELGLEPFGQVHRTYYITRQTDMIIFLVEGAFMPHPGDELFLLSDDNLRRLAQAVLQGLEDHLTSLAK
ncbi:MAG: N-acetylmuramoyl-L-alanine amidase [Candidatus Neomarinimicrobiota bacterium]